MINKINVKYVKTNDEALTPTYSTPYAAGADLYNYISDVVVKPGQTCKIFTGIKVEIPEGYVGLVYARSGLACKSGVAPANKVGVIDSDYRGEIIVFLFNHSDVEAVIRKGDRVAQLVVMPYVGCEFEQCSTLDDTSRGEGGFGSSGK